jgi:hypothetical protein
MNSPKTSKRNRSEDSPRNQRSIEDKKNIIDFYNSIKGNYGSKSATVQKFDLKYVSVLDKILTKETEINELLEQNQLDSKRKRLRMGQNQL